MLWLTTECVMLLLQHGARINYSHMFLVSSPKRVRKQHSEEFIQLLRAADTDFSGVRQQIASLDKKEMGSAKPGRPRRQPLPAADTTDVVRHQRQTSASQSQRRWNVGQDREALCTKSHQR